MTYLNNVNGLWKWQLFGMVYAIALLAGLPVVAGWPGAAVGIVELIGVFVVYLAICAAVVGVLFGVVYVGVFAHNQSLT
jgi:hypothetical protein